MATRARGQGRDYRDSAAEVHNPDKQNKSGDAGKPRITAYVYFVGFIAALGGLLFGYDTGVISGAQGFLKKDFHLTATTQEIAVSAVLIGTILGAASGGKLGDWLGRKKTLIVMAIIFAIGAILTAIASSLWLFVAFRILVGYGIGAASVVSPMFTSEQTPPRVRGAMVFLFQFFITVGILVAYVVDYAFASVFNLGWRWMFAVAIIPAALLGVGMFFLSDTPRWLASKGKWDEAKEVMERIAPGHADEDVKGIRRRLDEERHSSLKELFGGPLKWALIVALGLAVLQQLVGINTIIYYAPIVTGYSGIATASGTGSLIGAMIVGAVNVLATVVAIFLVDRVGRRPLLLFGTTGTMLTLIAAGILFMVGAKQHGTFLLVDILLYIVAFAIGLGPVYWLMASEVFPTRLRGAGSSISTVGNWAGNLVVSITFLTLMNTIGRPFTFWLYAAFAAAQIVFVWFLVPETKGKPLEDIEDYWANGRTWENVEGDEGGVAAEGSRA